MSCKNTVISLHNTRNVTTCTEQARPIHHKFSTPELVPNPAFLYLLLYITYLHYNGLELLSKMENYH